jgi:GTPase
VTERAILVHIYPDQKDDPEAFLEFQALAQAAGVTPAALLTTARRVPDPKYFIGRGKVTEIQTHLQLVNASLVLFNCDLAPRQERNLEQLLQCRILGRTSLVLDIFAQRARSFEGKLQVLLAQLQHLSSRLIRGWTHLERQRGGIGLRGPGETQLETDRRLIRNRIKWIRAKLEKVKQQRQQSSQTRRKTQIPLVALIGYTNAGKSTLFNRLTGANTGVADQLFATLDPLLRRVYLPNGHSIVLADTVGFIRQLPADLIEAFSATLEETREADLLLHVVDASSHQRLVRIQEVQNVLKTIGAQHVPQLLVYNKIDNIQDLSDMAKSPPFLELSALDFNRAFLKESYSSEIFWVSSTTGTGLDLLKEALMKQLCFPKMKSL